MRGGFPRREAKRESIRRSFLFQDKGTIQPEKFLLIWSEEKMEIEREKLVGEGWQLINGVSGERIEGEKLMLWYTPVVVRKFAMSEKRVQSGQENFVKKVEVKIQRGTYSGKFNSLNGCYGSGYSPMEGFPHMSEKLKEIGIKVIRFPQDDGFKFTLATIFPDDTKPVEDLNSYNFKYMDAYMEEAKKTGATLIWTALYDIGGGDFYHEKSGFQGGRCPRCAEKWAKVVRKVVERYNNGWNYHHIIPIDYVECLNEPLGLGGCSPQKYFEVYKYFSQELSKFNKNTKYPVKLVGFGEPVHLQEDYSLQSRNLPSRKPKRDPAKLKVFREFMEYVDRNNLKIDAVSIHPYVHGSPYDIYMLTSQYRDEMNTHGWSDKELIITEYGTIRSLVGKSYDFDFISQVLASFQTTTKLFLQGLVNIATGDRIMPSANPKKQRRKMLSSLFFDRYGNPKPATLAIKLLSFVEKQTPYISYNLAPNKDNLGAIVCKNRDETKFSLLFSNCSPKMREVKIDVEEKIKVNRIEVYEISKGKIEKETLSSGDTPKVVKLNPFEVKLFIVTTE
jgi:hypothetical protein